MRSAWWLVVLVAPLLAGCTSDGLQEQNEPGGSPELEAGRGGILGLVVDDRFRPIELVDEAANEHQADGFVLLQETGEEARTNANGEFAFTSLEPGEYTLRVRAQGHEATPRKVEVMAGQYSETSIVARRILSAGSVIIAEEYNGFIPCSIFVVAQNLEPNCFEYPIGGELPYFSKIWRDYTNNSALSWMVTEFQFNREPGPGGTLSAVMRSAAEDYSPTIIHSSQTISAGDYIRLRVPVGTISPDGDDFTPWMNEDRVSFAFWEGGSYGEEMGDAYEPVHAVTKTLPCEPEGPCVVRSGMRNGVGASFGLQAKIIISSFLGEPEVDPSLYCILC